MRRKRYVKTGKWFWILIAAGVMLMLYPLFTNIYANISQHSLLARQEQAAGQENEAPAIEAPQDERPLPAQFTSAVIKLPTLGVEAVVLPGTTPEVLNKSPGWYEQSALPGQGNTAIAGHRTMYGAWFRHVDSLQAGDPIILLFEGQELQYRVDEVYPVAKNDWSVIDPTPAPALTLTTCHPVGSAAQRLVVRATLIATRFNGLF